MRWYNVFHFESQYAICSSYIGKYGKFMVEYKCVGTNSQDYVKSNIKHLVARPRKCCNYCHLLVYVTRTFNESYKENEPKTDVGAHHLTLLYGIQTPSMSTFSWRKIYESISGNWLILKKWLSPPFPLIFLVCSLLPPTSVVMSGKITAIAEC